MVRDQPAGRIEVFYIEQRPHADEGPFLKEERKLLDSIADRIGHAIQHRELKTAFDKPGREPAPRRTDERGGRSGGSSSTS